MSQKIEKPSLSGQRIKTRKRDEKEKHDPIGFRNAIIIGLENCSESLDFEAISKFLDTAGGKLDYKRYGECLFDILIAGDLLANSGLAVSQDGEGLPKCSKCIFNSPDDIDLNILKNWEQVFIKVTRRYKYLEVMFHEEIKKILTFLKCYSVENRQKLSFMVYLWLSNGALQFSDLSALENPHLIKDFLALNFLTDVFKWWLQDKSSNSLLSAVKKSSFESQLKKFFPDNNLGHQHFRNGFEQAGLHDILKLYNDQHQQSAKKELQEDITKMLQEENDLNEIKYKINEYVSSGNITEQETISIIWSAIMASQEWSKKDDVLKDQAIRYLKVNLELLKEYTTQEKSEYCLLIKVQDYCYTNVNFIPIFQKIVCLFYKFEILSEVTIMKWFKPDNTGKGKIMFMEQIKKFVEWLQVAEEETDSDS